MIVGAEETSVPWSIWFAILFGLTASFLAVPAVWREREPFTYRTLTIDWPLGTALLHAALRSLPYGAFTFIPMLLALVGTHAAPPVSDISGVALIVFGLAFMPGWPLLALFNWPAIFVPPPHRGKPGLIVEWWQLMKEDRARQRKEQQG
jgi:hypothetical protein